ncbi:XRE family transcriptional regulator [Herbaspirillum rubrisubalbicans]|uniref:XRE family transcriptional regulator n=1 Tax=Herbaspirillum rubrisubalbicans TaxID=80842 RepID=A0ABX9C468_9BURK|nr:MULTISPECIES: response regulator transcription factor [Herbaspirillum]MCP1576454.1 two-component system response regulator QseB [Herbaspirillum rubrisubalbicans]RAM65173.1 XRE family transcriptional regulator [Herbaspirillum rubrisubalbicans]RAN48805.1 XRE family transcriptional regulator [Herbaspirillum rubrisubalbicans]
MRLLLVEDDFMLGDSVRKGFYPLGFVVDWMRDGISAQAALEVESYAAVVLDLGLPGRNGLEVLKKLRQDRDNTPVIIASACDAVQQRIAGLNAGADDYVNKPFDLEELAARIRALLRRVQGRQSSTMVHGELEFDPAAQVVRHRGRRVALSAREMLVLSALIEKPEAVLSRAQLVERIYGWNEEVDSNTIEVHIHALRKKIAPDVVRNIRGLGYTMAH